MGMILQLTLFLLTYMVHSLTDYTLSCQRGYRISGIKRLNSPRQRDQAGSLSIECQSIVETDLDSITCQTLTSTPQCNGQLEGCTGSQWLAGFHAYAIENNTNAVLLDPVCCSSSKINVDSLTCATERLNSPVKPFEHTILGQDLVYRGMQCWHQYNVNNTLVDLIWKVEICQAQPTHSLSLDSNPLTGSCPPCECHCGIDTCGNGNEPIRVTHKHMNTENCGCDCLCRYECI
ncbi:unnamed protein product [Bursaphelenchus xylophilus]|uniref:(pine wood nematode) hypothetical protein n=1 Tax=Bursaphelenchus xylophilus TaxID=6326 RepID=A0A1I7SWB8_BURXY|nr:unnamed protein product [Bursaphelenchus xylophilus]CAG9099156.1 unnamed protein product [Bursaphelenchus xylophilus]